MRLALRLISCLFWCGLAVAAPAGELRGLWVIRTSLTSPEAVEKVVDDAAQNGFNTLFVQVRGRGDALYKSRLEPRSLLLKGKPADFDPLAQILTSAGRKRIGVHVWLSTLLVHSGPTMPGPGHVLNQHPEWVMVPRRLADSLYARRAGSPAGLKKIREEIRRRHKSVEGLYLDPAEPGVRKFILDVCLDLLAQYDVEAIHLDYVRYPSPEFGFGPAALDAFASEVDRDLSASRRRQLRKSFGHDRLIYTRTYPSRWDAFRREQVTSLIRELGQGLKAKRPDLILTAAATGDTQMAKELRFQDWKNWMEKGLLDAVCPMVYVSDVEAFKDQVAIARGYSFGTPVWAGIGAWQLPVTETIEKIELTRRIGADGFILFAYGALSNETSGQRTALTRLRSYLLIESTPAGGK